MIQAIDIYYRLRDEVDRQVAGLEEVHSKWMACRKGCCSCCLELTVWPVEFYAILGHMKSSNLSKPQINLDKDCGLFGEKKCDHNLS